MPLLLLPNNYVSIKVTKISVEILLWSRDLRCGIYLDNFVCIGIKNLNMIYFPCMFSGLLIIRIYVPIYYAFEILFSASKALIRYFVGNCDHYYYLSVLFMI